MKCENCKEEYEDDEINLYTNQFGMGCIWLCKYCKPKKVYKIKRLKIKQVGEKE